MSLRSLWSVVGDSLETDHRIVRFTRHCGRSTLPLSGDPAVTEQNIPASTATLTLTAAIGDHRVNGALLGALPLDMEERMTVDRAFVAESDAERERLRSLVTRLSDDELSRPMPAGWTVAAVLAHIGFWDARAIYWLDRWESGVEPSAPDYETREDVEWVNNAGKPLCLALPARDAAQLALRLAEEADGKVAALSDAMLATIRAVGCPFDLSRANHRREHLDDIERALGV
jgi:DinB superfamily